VYVCVCVCVLISSYKDTSHTGFWIMLMTHFNLSFFLKTQSVNIVCSQILGVRILTYELGGGHSSVL
jgi:hypothetical protein